MSAPDPDLIKQTRITLTAEMKRAVAAKNDIIKALEKELKPLRVATDTSSREIARLSLLLLQAEQRLKTIKTSWTWKLCAPVRVLERIFLARPRIARIERSPFFDADWYRKSYPGAFRKKTIRPAAHYFLKGAAQGKDPGPCFNTLHYLSQCPALIDSGENPLIHFERIGRVSGFSPVPPGK